MASGAAESVGDRIDENRQVAALRKAAHIKSDDSEVNWVDKMESLLTSGSFKAELDQAYDFLQTRLPTKATGAACAVRPTAVLREAGKFGTPAAT